MVLDDCDDLIRQAPPAFFSELRALRDNFKVRLAYLTLTRREPAFLRPDTKEYEELFELLSAPGHTLPVPPYSPSDAATMIRRLAARLSPPRDVPEAAILRLFEWSGGHAGLIRSLFFAASGAEEILAADGLERLAAGADVSDECRKIWDSLEREEQAALRAVAAGRRPEAEGLRRLERRGLVRLGGAEGQTIFSPVFQGFMVQLVSPSPGRRMEIEFPGAGGLVRVDGRPVSRLGRAEVEILRRLAQARPGPCSRLELLEAMRQGEQGGRPSGVAGDPLRRLERYVQRLQARLDAIGLHIRPHGDGYRLESQ